MSTDTQVFCKRYFDTEILISEPFSKRHFDTKILIVRPYLTKNISRNDFLKINQTTDLKYQPLKSDAPNAIAGDAIEFTEDEETNSLADAIKELDELYESFGDLAKKAEKELESLVYVYDISLPENETIANAERDIFGSASGVITFAKYKKVLALEQIITREISERMINKSEKMNVA